MFKRLLCVITLTAIVIGASASPAHRINRIANTCTGISVASELLGSKSSQPIVKA